MVSLTRTVVAEPAYVVVVVVVEPAYIVVEPAYVPATLKFDQQ